MSLDHGGESTRKYAQLLERFNASAQSGQHQLVLLTVDDSLVLKLYGVANQQGYNQLAERALEIMNSSKCKRLVIDLSHCEHLSSSPLGLIGLMIMSFVKRGGEASMVTGNPLVLRSMRVLGIDKACRIVATIDEVLG